MLKPAKRDRLQRELNTLLNKKNKTLKDINKAMGIKWALDRY
jgi:hypothetical protein